MADRLHIGEQETTLHAGDGSDPVVLPIGSLSIAQRHFHHEPPSAGEIEAAIDTVEDALMPVIPRLRGSAPLLTEDAESVALLAAVGLPSDIDAELDIAAIERLFTRLAHVASGRPASSEGLPERRSFAANLLILRELMHHAGRDSVRVLASVRAGERR